MPRLLLAVIPALAFSQISVIEGDYIEDRSNHVYGCYCEWSGESVTGGTEATLGWRFTRGVYAGVSLAGVKAALVMQGQSTLSQGAPARRSVLVLDRRATPAQRHAAAQFLAAHFGAILGDIIEPRVLDIEFKRPPYSPPLKAPGLISMEIRRARPAEDSLPGATLWYDPFIPLTVAVLGTTLHTAYQGREFSRRWDKTEAGVRGYFGTFRIENPAPPAAPSS